MTREALLLKAREYREARRLSVHPWGLGAGNQTLDEVLADFCLSELAAHQEELARLTRERDQFLGDRRAVTEDYADERNLRIAKEEEIEKLRKALDEMWELAAFQLNAFIYMEDPFNVVEPNKLIECDDVDAQHAKATKEKLGEIRRAALQREGPEGGK